MRSATVLFGTGCAGGRYSLAGAAGLDRYLGLDGYAGLDDEGLPCG
jgi:hypothetical protein